MAATAAAVARLTATNSPLGAVPGPRTRSAQGNCGVCRVVTSGQGRVAARSTGKGWRALL